MKLWWIAGLNMIAVMAATRIIAAEGAQPVKDPDGNTVGLVVICCESCQSAAGSTKRCETGVQQGWLGGKPCGKCMLVENAGQTLRSAYDLHFSGKLVDDAGAPRKERFVRMFLPNGWTVRSRTAEDGEFRLALGATEPRKSKRSPLLVDLGTRVDAKAGTDDYSFYLLPQSYKPCSPGAATTVVQKGSQPPRRKPKGIQ
jgi:hypothetical protein